MQRHHKSRSWLYVAVPTVFACLFGGLVLRHLLNARDDVGVVALSAIIHEGAGAVAQAASLPSGASDDARDELRAVYRHLGELDRRLAALERDRDALRGGASDSRGDVSALRQGLDKVQGELRRQSADLQSLRAVVGH